MTHLTQFPCLLAANTHQADYQTVYFLEAFLIMILSLGLYAGRNIQSFREYVLADKIYGTGLLFFTFMATHIGGANVLEVPAIVFTDGIIISIAFLGLIIAFLFRALVIAPGMKQFEECLTMGDVMSKLYGRYAQVITGILGLLYSICITTVQLLGLGLIAESLLGVPATWSIIIGGLVLASYSAVGGIKAVTITDVFQFFLLIATIILIAGVALWQVGGLHNLLEQVPADKLLVLDHPKFSYYLVCFLLWSVFSVGVTSPPTFQRLLMARDTKQLRNQYLLASFLDPIIQLLILLIALCGLVLYPSIEPKNVVTHLIQQTLPVSLQYFATAGLLAVVMSTADSYLHAAGVTLTHDIIRPVLKNPFGELRWSRYATLVMGLISIVLGLLYQHMLSLVFSAMQFTGPLLIFPLVVGILGVRVDKRAFFIASVFTLATFVLARWYLPASDKHLAVLYSILANGISFFGAYLLFQSYQTK
jgi:solute:Na+ symporter, SSS family